jgi:hypothetical protein
VANSLSCRERKEHALAEELPMQLEYITEGNKITHQNVLKHLHRSNITPLSMKSAFIYQSEIDYLNIKVLQIGQMTILRPKCHAKK